MPPALAAILQRIRSLPLSIGRLTFGSFLLLLAVITATSVASVIAIRHSHKPVYVKLHGR